MHKAGLHLSKSPQGSI